jgi:hypothetical protein
MSPESRRHNHEVDAVREARSVYVFDASATACATYFEDFRGGRRGLELEREVMLAVPNADWRA